VRGQFLLLLALVGSWAPLGADTTVVILRHAEKGSRSLHAQLSTTGHRRAAALAGTLAALHPAAVFASDYQRTQQTVGPLAQRLGLEVQVRARGAESALGRELLRRFQGQTVVVCGHSDSLAILVKALGYDGFFPEVWNHDGLWVLRVPEQPGPVLLEARQQPPVPGQ
jgi:broad specificity phosphatase PhoE